MREGTCNIYIIYLYKVVNTAYNQCLCDAIKTEGSDSVNCWTAAERLAIVGTRKSKGRMSNGLGIETAVEL